MLGYFRKQETAKIKATGTQEEIRERDRLLMDCNTLEKDREQLIAEKKDQKKKGGKDAEAEERAIRQGATMGVPVGANSRGPSNNKRAEDKKDADDYTLLAAKKLENEAAIIKERNEERLERERDREERAKEREAERQEREKDRLQRMKEREEEKLEREREREGARKDREEERKLEAKRLDLKEKEQEARLERERMESEARIRRDDQLMQLLLSKM